MKYSIAALLALALSSCAQPSHVDLSEVSRLYGERKNSELGKLISTLTPAEQSMVLDEVAGYRLAGFERTRDPGQLDELSKVLTAASQDTFVKNDPLAQRDVLIYRALTDEALGKAANWNEVCGLAKHIRNGCQCRWDAIVDNLQKIDDPARLARVDQVIRLSKSGAAACPNNSGLFSTFAMALENEVSPTPIVDINEKIAASLKENAEMTSFWLCALRRQYLDYGKSKLSSLERSGVFSCASKIF